jgi:hypothetical protein
MDKRIIPIKSKRDIQSPIKKRYGRNEITTNSV